jgi:hypothetical protein
MNTKRVHMRRRPHLSTARTPPWTGTDTTATDAMFPATARSLRGHVDKHNTVFCTDRLHCLVVRVPGYRSRGPGSIHGATRFSEK